MKQIKKKKDSKKDINKLKARIEQLEKEKEELKLKLAQADKPVPKNNLTKEQKEAELPKPEPKKPVTSEKPKTFEKYYSKEIKDGQVREVTVINGEKKETVRKLEDKDIPKLLEEHDQDLRQLVKKMEQFENAAACSMFPFGIGFYL